jgi:hypothetical protein
MQIMRTQKAVYWITTAWVAAIMGISGALAVTHSTTMMQALTHLGYPAYFSGLLGIAKLLGVSVLLAPSTARLKEWAYAGFGITIISASYSHLLSGDGFQALEPWITFVALAASYLTRPASRKFFPSASVDFSKPAPATQSESGTCL